MVRCFVLRIVRAESTHRRSKRSRTAYASARKRSFVVSTPRNFASSVVSLSKRSAPSVAISISRAGQHILPNRDGRPIIQADARVGCDLSLAPDGSGVLARLLVGPAEHADRPDAAAVGLRPA